ncbi:MAG: hypothetical protein AAF218_06840 [Pseudomonadota bacterium]
MLDAHHSVDLTAEELELIETALQTQEKILSVQSRAGGTLATSRLDRLRALSRRLGGYSPRTPRPSLWTRLRRHVPCPQNGQV